MFIFTFRSLRYLVELYGRSNTQLDANTTSYDNYDLNIEKELFQFIKNSFHFNTLISNTNLTNVKNSCLKYFTQYELPLNQHLKIQLTNVDSIKHFGVVINSDLEKRWQFLNQFHQWHKENRKTSLKPLFASRFICLFYYLFAVI